MAAAPSLATPIAGITTWTLSGRGNGGCWPFVCSHKQYLASSCNLSMDSADPGVYVRGGPWLSVVVDVLSDVDSESLRSRALTGGMLAG